MTTLQEPACPQMCAETAHLSSAAEPTIRAGCSGHDLLPWLRATDRLIWEPPALPDANGNLQDDIVMTFPKPAGATQAKLVANAATGLWGSYMIKKMVELRGRDLERLVCLDGREPSLRGMICSPGRCGRNYSR